MRQNLGKVIDASYQEYGSAAMSGQSKKRTNGDRPTILGSREDHPRSFFAPNKPSPNWLDLHPHGSCAQNGSLCLYNLQRIHVSTKNPSQSIPVAKRRCLPLCLIIFMALLPGVSIPRAHAADRVINVAAAADLSSALQEIAANFEKRAGVSVKLSFGASGALTQQIQNGAPFDIFLSADMDYPRQLIAGGHAEESTLYRYAVGELVLWTQKDSLLDVEHRGMQALLDPAVKKIAIANPEHAPYGRAAVAALKHYGVYEKVVARIVLGENVSQAAQFVESGNAQAGFVALSHALAPAMQGKGKYWVVPGEAYPPLVQAAVLVSHSPHRQDAAAFLDYLKTPEVAQLLRRSGLNLPQAK
jgi:molybdate transport system substrate-binding protein